MEHFVYTLYLITFLLFPLVGRIIAHYIKPEASKRFLIGFGIFFLIHNGLFLAGYSIIGDYPDYILFSSEYLFISIIAFVLYKIKKPIPIALGVFGRIILTLGFLQGLIGVIMFAVLAQDFEADKIFTVYSKDHSYYIRRYTFGFATLEDTTFTYEVYKPFANLPIEKKITHICESQLESEANLDRAYFNIQIDEETNKERLLLMSGNQILEAYEID